MNIYLQQKYVSFPIGLILRYLMQDWNPNWMVPPLYNCLRAWTASSCDSAITMIILIDSKMPWYICDNISSRIIMLFHLDIDVFMVMGWNDRIDLKKHFTPRVHYTTQTPYKHFQLYLDFSRWWGWPGQSRHKMCVWTSWVLYVPQ